MLLLLSSILCNLPNLVIVALANRVQQHNLKSFAHFHLPCVIPEAGFIYISLQILTTNIVISRKYHSRKTRPEPLYAAGFVCTKMKENRQKGVENG